MFCFAELLFCCRNYSAGGVLQEIKPLRQSLEQEQERLPKFEKFVVDKTVSNDIL